MFDFHKKYGFGKGIAAPQIGILKRLVYIHRDEPLVMINPEISERSDEIFEVWDNCMSFPNLLVRINRHRSVTVRYLDDQWERREIKAENEYSELLQHEIDHLDGILATMRAVDGRSFADSGEGWRFKGGNSLK
jgi:peptide deformylase